MMAENAVTQILKTLPSAAGATFLALFPIVNPFGGIPLFFSLTSGFPASERNRTAGKTAMYVFGILWSSCSLDASCSIFLESRCRC